MKITSLLILVCPLTLLAIGCRDEDKKKSTPTVAGTATFVLGADAGTPALSLDETASVAPGDQFIVSPSKAMITFTSVVFRGTGGETLGTSDFENCVVTYDRSLKSGASLLDCEFKVPIGEIAELAVYFDKTVQIMVNDTTFGIYSTTSSPTQYSTSAPSGGAELVPMKITIGAGTSRATSIVLSKPIAITADMTPRLYITTDMIHSIQLEVDDGGTTLSLAGSNDPIALFGGLTQGYSLYYSGATTIEAIKVQGTPSLRIFYDQENNPLYLMGTTCGVDGPKGAHASAPTGTKIGGWLGKDSTNKLAWALPTDSSYAKYAAYFVMAEQTNVGQSTTLYCKATDSPPSPVDGKTYGSGVPAMESPTSSTVLNLLAK